MSFSAPWWSGSYQVNGSGVAVASFEWRPNPLVTGLDGRVIVSRWWTLIWLSPTMPASEFSTLTGLVGQAVSVTTPDKDSPESFLLYLSAVLEKVSGEQRGKLMLETRIEFRVYV